MKKIISILSLVLLCCVASASPGAIWTTVLDGSVVNGNIYALGTDVYLNGGPGAHQKCTVAGLPDGDYAWAVTDPSNSVLLSTDSVTERRFRVAGGQIVSYLGTTHLLGTNPCGGITIQLEPFSHTPSPGGEYSVSVSPTIGFDKSTIKNDNFKIRTDANCLSKAVKVCVSCPENISIPCSQVNGTGAIVNFEEPIVLPTIGTTVTCNPPSGSFFPQGVTTVYVTAVNTKGQSAGCSFTVTVGDCPQYHITCPGDITVCAPGAGVCTATGLFSIPAGNDLVTVTANHQPSEAFPLGTTVVTFTAKQGDVLLETCSFNVNVQDCSNGVICGHVVNTDSNLPIAGWRLVLSGAGNGIGYTDATGSYCFSSLLPGVYTVTELPPVGCWVATTATTATFTVSCANASNRFDVTFGEACRCEIRY